MHDFIKNTNSAKMSNITPTFGLCQKYANARKIRFLRTVFDLSLVESWFISIICEKTHYSMLQHTSDVFSWF